MTSPKQGEKESRKTRAEWRTFFVSIKPHCSGLTAPIRLIAVYMTNKLRIL